MATADVPYLKDVLLRPPFSAIVALLIVAGMGRVAVWWGGRMTRQTRPTAIEIALGFVAVNAVVAALAHGVGWFGLATLATLRILAGGLIVANLGWFDRGRMKRIREGAGQLREGLSAASWLQRWIWIGGATIVIGLGCATLGPPTETDTLTYHLAVPLDWLQHGARPTPDWLHARLAALGEGLNLLGLAAGTDCLGAVLQIAGAVVAAIALVAVARTALDVDLALALVLSCPLLSFMVLTDKPQLLPSAATTIVIAFVIVSRIEGGRPVSRLAWWSCWAAIGLAVGSKYSFLLSGGLAGLVLLRESWRDRRIAAMLVTAASALLFFAAPVFLRTFLWYGDPVSPALEKFRPDSDFIVATFAAYLRNFEMDHSLASLINAPYHVTLTTHPTLYTTVLGVGSLSALLALLGQRRNYDLLAATITLAGLAWFGGQLQARFFLEPYLWFGLLAVSSASVKGKTWLRGLLAVQLGASVAVALFSAALLFPGALTAAGRERVLTRSASEYRLNTWLNGRLPASAVVASDRGATLYLDRQSLPRDFARIVDQALLPQAEKNRRLLDALVRHHVTNLVIHEPVALSPYRYLLQDLGPPLDSAAFTDAARNPWSDNESKRVWVYDFSPKP